MLPSVRPLVQRWCAAGLYGSSQTVVNQLGRRCGELLAVGTLARPQPAVDDGNATRIWPMTRCARRPTRLVTESLRHWAEVVELRGLARRPAGKLRPRGSLGAN
jgi:hypothetical protein